MDARARGGAGECARGRAVAPPVRDRAGNSGWPWPGPAVSRPGGEGRRQARRQPSGAALRGGGRRWAMWRGKGPVNEEKIATFGLFPQCRGVSFSVAWSGTRLGLARAVGPGLGSRSLSLTEKLKVPLKALSEGCSKTISPRFWFVLLLLLF